MAETFNNLIAKEPTNLLYINDSLVNIDGYDYKEITDKHLDYEITELSSLSSLSKKYTGRRAMAGVYSNSTIYLTAQILDETTGNVLPSGLSNVILGITEMGSVDINDTLTMSSWVYSNQEISYTWSTTQNPEGGIGDIVDISDYSPYDISILSSGNSYYDSSTTTYWLCQSVSSTSFVLKRLTMPSTPTPSTGNKLYRYSSASNSWIDINLTTINASYFYPYNGYIYYLDEVTSGSYSLYKLSGSGTQGISKTLLTSNAKYGPMCIFNDKLCVSSFSDHKLYSINTSSGAYTLESTLPVAGEVVTNSSGSYLFSSGNGIYKYNNGNWDYLEFLDSSFSINDEYFVLNDNIYILQYGSILYYYNDRSSLTYLYSFYDTDSANPNSAGGYATITNLAGNIYLLGVNGDSETLKGIRISILGTSYDTEYVRSTRKTIRFDSYISNTSWSQIESPTFEGGLLANNIRALVSCGDYIYAFDQYGSGKKYDGSHWTSIQMAPYQLYEGATLIGAQGKIWLFGSSAKGGGLTMDKTKSKQIHVYDPDTNTWTRLKNIKKPSKNMDIPYELMGAIPFYINGEILLFGGQLGGTSGRKRFYKFNISTQKWSKFTLPFEISAGNAFILNNYIHVYVRYDGGSFKYYNQIWCILRFDDPDRYDSPFACYRVINALQVPGMNTSTTILVSDNNNTVYDISQDSNYMYSRNNLPQYSVNSEYTWNSVCTIPTDNSRLRLFVYHNGIMYMIFTTSSSTSYKAYVQSGLRLYTMRIADEEV